MSGTQNVRALSDELTKILFDLGPRRLVLVEGPDDFEILRLWYRDKQSSLLFHSAHGNRNIIRLLDEFEACGRGERIYGIRDRDFRSEQSIRKDEEKHQGRLFTLSRYSVENYILEPKAVWEELSLFVGDKFSIKDGELMEQKLLQIFQSLHMLMAANWIFSEQPREDEVAFFPPGHDVDDSTKLMETTKRRLKKLAPEEVAGLMRSKAEILKSNLATIEKAQTVINGKHVLHHLHLFALAEKSGLSKEHLRNLLARTVKEKIGIPLEIRTIIETNILGTI